MAVTVKFIGVCTHVLDKIDVPRRIVLANARNGKDTIPAHFSYLSIRKEHLDGDPPSTSFLRLLAGRPEHTWSIEGATLRLDPPAAGIPHDRTAADGLPKLPPVDGFAINPSIVGKPGDRQRVDAFFDVGYGTVRAFCVEKAYGAILENGGEPWLDVAPFTGGNSVRLKLRNDAEVILQHVPATPTHDDDSHYKLHYLIGGDIPAGAKDSPPWTACGSDPGEPSLGTGCSSSPYP